MKKEQIALMWGIQAELKKPSAFRRVSISFIFPELDAILGKLTDLAIITEARNDE